MPLESVISIMFEMLDYSQLLALRRTSRELRAVASQDHAWILKLNEMVDDFELSENELVLPAYPEPERGDQRDEFSFFPIESQRVHMAGFVFPYSFRLDPPLRVKDGVLEDMMHLESGSVETFSHSLQRTKIYKARPLPLRCCCCDVECDSYVSFTSHCTLPSHKKKLDPSTRFDPRFINSRYNDPRHDSTVYEALSMMAKYGAMHRYKIDMDAWFLDSYPEPKLIKASPLCQRGAWKNMKAAAANARANIRLDAARFELSTKEVRAICLDCTAEKAAEIWLQFILQDFEQGLQGYALEVVQNGWKNLSANSSDSHLTFLANMTGQDY
jgi:hypothetical protein